MDPEKSCPVNLGLKQKRARLLFGIFFFLPAAGLSIYFVFAEIHPLFRLAVFPLFLMAFLGFFQAKSRTCVVLGLQGKRHLDTQEERIWDRAISKILLQRSHKIIIQAVFLAAVLTAVCVITR